MTEPIFKVCINRKFKTERDSLDVAITQDKILEPMVAMLFVGRERIGNGDGRQEDLWGLSVENSANKR